MNTQIVLASASPRRREILEMLGCQVTVRPSHIAEEINDLTDPKKIVAALAAQKARAVPHTQQELLLGADTVVSIGRRILGKPSDQIQAKEMLTLLSGREHSVFTGFCLIQGGREIIGTEETKVLFHNLSQQMIEDYLVTGEPFDKAGAYGIQGKGCLLVKEIHGDFFNVVGLPASRIFYELKQWEKPSC